MKIYKRVLSLVIALALIVGLIPISAITANAYSWTLTNGGTVTSGQTATITCYGGAAYQITNFEWDCTSNTIATITGTDANGEVIYTRQINGSPYLTKTFCYGGEQYVIEVIKGSIEIGYTIANTAAPKITVTENYSDLPVASAYDYILVENSTSDDAWAPIERHTSTHKMDPQSHTTAQSHRLPTYTVLHSPQTHTSRSTHNKAVTELRVPCPRKIMQLWAHKHGPKHTTTIRTM